MKATECKAYEFCKKSVRLKATPKYVKRQMRLWMKIAEGKDSKYYVSVKKIKQIENILKLLVMPKGLKAGQSMYKCATGYQWLIYIAMLCTVYRDNPKKRRYETGLLEICRKNFKTYTIGTIFIILFLTLIYEYKGTKRFKLLRDYIKFKLNENTLIPLAYSNNRMDGRMPNAFIADEVGALPNGYPVDAMRSGQLNVFNKLGFIISTKYPTIDNPFEDEVAYAKKVLDGIEKDDTVFALLYEPDKTSDWETDDLVLKQANPASLEIPEIWDDLVKKRARAIAIEKERENFVTKHCNIIYQGQGTETFIDVKDVQACKVADIDWNGRVVYLGVDLSESNDNTSVAMVSVDDDDNILAESFAFIPADRITEKTISERVNYQELLKSDKVFACGDRVISYAFVEQFILSLESRYNVQIQAIGYDRWNALSTAQKLANEGYNTVQIKQYSSVLHSPTKRMKEAILKQKFKYTENKLLEINYQNAKCAYDTNKNMYVSKKKSNGKVDMVVSLINAIYLLEQDYFLNEGDFTFQMI